MHFLFVLFFYDREVTSRMDPLKFKSFNDMNKIVHHRFKDLYEVVNVNIKNKLIAERQALEQVYSEIESMHSQGLHFLKWQLYHVQMNFMRVREAMEERTFAYLALGFQEFSYQV